MALGEQAQERRDDGCPSDNQPARHHKPQRAHGPNQPAMLPDSPNARHTFCSKLHDHYQTGETLAPSQAEPQRSQHSTSRNAYRDQTPDDPAYALLQLNQDRRD